MKSALIQFQINPNISRALVDSLGPEIEREIPRTEVNIIKDDDITLEIHAEDTNALRAAINSYLRWAKVTMDTVEEIDKERRRETEM